MGQNKKNDEIYDNAIKIAQLYYYHGLTTDAIADELNFSRPKVSRLLSFARQEGLVDIKIIDKRDLTKPISSDIVKRYPSLNSVYVVAVPDDLNVNIRNERVAQYAANYINSILEPDMVCGLTCDQILFDISKYLIPKPVQGLSFVQIGGFSAHVMRSDILIINVLQHFAQNFHAKMTLFPVSAVFGNVSTKEAIWNDKSIQTIIDLQNRSDIILFSINTNFSEENNALISGGHITKEDIAELQRENVIGEISTVFFKSDGLYEDITLNKRTSGPKLELFQKVARSVCVISGSEKIPGLIGALNAGYVSELIIDEPAAKVLLEMA